MERHRTDKRFWSWHVSIVLLIIVFLIALVVLFKIALTTETEKNRGKERNGRKVVAVSEQSQKFT